MLPAPGAQAASDLSRDSRRERRIKKTQTDRDHGDEAHTLYICSNMTADPIDSGGLGGRPARPPQGRAWGERARSANIAQLAAGTRRMGILGTGLGYCWSSVFMICIQNLFLGVNFG